ncbi:MAG TPA: hypothetical protein VKA01_02085 [Vicinamibacteria bacterium]|nr:hypothetical protein [Vicinamibacteria bacterium]
MLRNQGTLVVAVLLVGAAWPAAAQAPQPTPTPLAVVYEKVPGVELRFVNYRWRPEIFGPMEKGGSGPVESKRPWAFARIVNDVPLKVGERTLPVGHGLLVFHPNLDGSGMSLEVRSIDMRRVVDLNVLAVPPAGDTYYKAPLVLEATPEVEPRMVMTLDEAAGMIVLHFRYGDRRFSWSFSRR